MENPSSKCEGPGYMDDFEGCLQEGISGNNSFEREDLYNSWSGRNPKSTKPIMYKSIINGAPETQQNEFTSSTYLQTSFKPPVISHPLNI
jgi:hypothetical protein